MAVSRRHLFRMGALAFGTIGSVVVVDRALPAGTSNSSSTATKSTKQAAGYQDQPKGDQHCGICANFVAPSDCRVVVGPVSPSGWCSLFQAKT